MAEEIASIVISPPENVVSEHDGALIENKKKGKIIQKNYVLNDTVALKKKLRNETNRKEAFNYGVDAKDGSSVVILMKTSFFEHLKAAYIQDLVKMDNITAADNALASKAQTEHSGDAFVEYSFDITFVVNSHVHSIKFTAYATTCKIQLQPLGEPPRNLDHLGKKTVTRYFADTFLFPWCEAASANKKYNEKEMIEAIKSEIVRLDLLKVDTRKGNTRSRISSAPSPDYKCVARNCKYTGLNSSNKLAVGVCDKCGCYEHFECSKTKSEDRDKILKGEHKYYCSICFIKNPTTIAFGGNTVTKIRSRSPSPHPLPKDVPDTVACEHCNYVTKDIQTLTLHSKEDHTFVCETCKDFFKTKSEVEKHIKDQHTRPCIICEMQFRTISELKEHMGSSHCPKCDMCDITFEKTEDLERHSQEKHVRDKHTVEIHQEHTRDPEVDLSIQNSEKNGDNTRKQELEKHMVEEHRATKHNNCDVCELQFDNTVLLNNHKKTHAEITHVTEGNTTGCNESRNEFKCPFCTETAKDKATLMTHMKGHDTSANMCSICELDFGTKEDLKIHMEKEHSSDCTVCGKKFKTSTEMKEHLQHCKRFLCGECNNTYFEECHLNEHINKKHGNSCNLCTLTFESEAKLKEHYNKEHRFKCDVCSQEVGSQDELKKHKQEVHEDAIEIVSYECETCKFQGSTIDIMLVHVIEEHSKKNKENQFICTECNFKCSLKDDLITHFKKEHMGQEKVNEEENIHEKYRQLKSNFERLNTLFQESLEEVDKIKSEYTAKVLEANEKYRVTLEENEELKEKVDVLFKLGRSYIDKANSDNPIETNKDKEITEEIVEVETQDPVSENSDLNYGDLSAWSTNKFRGFKRISPSTKAAPNKQTKTVTSAKTPPPPQDRPQSSSINERLQDIAMNNPVDEEVQSQPRRSVQYCHFFTNFGKCVFEEKTGQRCKFVHRIAPVCRSGTACTRPKCMYTHPNMGGRMNTNFLEQAPSFHMNTQPWQHMTNPVNPWAFMNMAPFQQPMGHLQQTRGGVIRN